MNRMFEVNRATLTHAKAALKRSKLEEVRNDCQDDEDHEKDLRDACELASDPTEAEDSGD